MHLLIAEIQVAVGCLVQLRSLHIVKLYSRRRMKNSVDAAAEAVHERPLTHFHLGMN